MITNIIIHFFHHAETISIIAREAFTWYILINKGSENYGEEDITMTEKLFEQLVNEIRNIKTNMVAKDDLKYMATKDDLKSMATKDDMEQIEMKLNRNSEQNNRNFNQIVRNTEHLSDLFESKKRQERILEILSLRSIEQESELRD